MNLMNAYLGRLKRSVLDTSGPRVIPLLLSGPLYEALEAVRFSTLEHDGLRQEVAALGRLEPGAYHARRFGGAGLDDFAEELDALLLEGCVTVDREGTYALTPLGFKFSNVIATLFKPPAVDALERAFLPT